MSANKNKKHFHNPVSIHKTLAYHLVAHAKYPYAPFRKRSECQRVWRQLKESFSEITAMVLMPDHLHLIVLAQANEPAKLQHKLSALLQSSQWQDVPTPQAIPNDVHLRRTVRYVHLNPCREGLCDDPLRWPWSTHRDYIGAATFPASEKSKRMTVQERKDFHKYVSADPSVHPLGTAIPLMPQNPVLLDLGSVVRAAEVVCRASEGAFQKKGRLRARLMGLLSGPLGIPASVVARHFGVHHSSVRPEACQGARDPMLAPLLMTLGDERLLPR